MNHVVFLDLDVQLGRSISGVFYATNEFVTVSFMNGVNCAMILATRSASSDCAGSCGTGVGLGTNATGVGFGLGATEMGEPYKLFWRNEE